MSPETLLAPAPPLIDRTRERSSPVEQLKSKVRARRARRTREALRSSNRELTSDWTAPPGFLLLSLRWILFWVNCLLVRTLFHLRVKGTADANTTGPLILAPNHSSSLDTFVLAASLPWSTIRHTRWAGRQGVVLKTLIHRLINRIAGVVPIRRNGTALSVAEQVLTQDEHLVWFPEGTRSKTGQLQAFKPGIVTLMQNRQISVLPVMIQGAHEALRPGVIFPSLFSRITVHFGQPVSYAALCEQNPDLIDQPTEQAELLRENWIQLKSLPR